MPEDTSDLSCTLVRERPKISKMKDYELALLGTVDMSQGQILKEEFQDWGLYKIEFDFTIKEFTQHHWINLFHFAPSGTNSQNWLENTNNRPVIHIKNDEKKMFVCFGPDFSCKFIDEVIEEMKRYHVVIQQCLEYGQVVYKVILNGKTMFSEAEPSPKIYESVKLYGSNPWSKSVGDENYVIATIENLKVEQDC